MIPGFDPQSAARRLEALVAAIQAFPPERRPTVLREYLDAELGRLEAMEDSHQAYLAECVLLAVDNMQDARLQSVEGRLAALESPDGPSMAEMLTEAAFVFALSFAALFAVEAVGGAVLLWAGQAALAPLAREAVQSADEALLATTRTQVSTLSALAARQELLAAERRGLSTVLDALRGGSLSSALWQVGKALLSPIATAKSIVDALAKTFAVSAEVETIQAQVLLSHLAMAEGAQTSVAARIAYEKALVSDAARPDALWRKFLDDASGNLALAPAFTVFENLWKDISQQTSQPAVDQVSEPFLASTPAGRLLTLMRDNRLAVREEYAVLRAGLRYRAADDSFVSDPLVTQLAGLVTELSPLRDAYRALEDNVRPLIVRGYEAALWWAYLQTNGMLGRDEGSAYQTYEHDDELQPGAIVEGYVITKVPPEVEIAGGAGSDLDPERPSFLYAADYYPGVMLLGEERAEYLYETFAAPYFRVSEHGTKLPFEYDPAAYVGARALPARLYKGWLENRERARLLDEMRLMVILFFLQLPELEDPTSSGLLTALGQLRGSTPSAAGWLSLHPAGAAPPPANPIADGSEARAAQASAPALDALLAQSGVLNEKVYATRRSELRAAIAELRNDITDMQELAAGRLKPADSARGIDVEAYNRLVTAEQAQLLDLYAEVVASARFDSGQVTSIETTYGALVDRLATWTLPPTTTRAPASPWRFENPAPTP